MEKTSILSREFAEPILDIARQNLENDGFLRGVAFILTRDGEYLMSPLDLPKTPEEKQAYMTEVGRSIRRSGKAIDEALMLSESWIVMRQDASNMFLVTPSRHPARREAIVLVGRDADRTRMTTVVQTFTRDVENRPVWGERPVESYNTPIETGDYAIGLIDYLFVRGRRQRRG